MGSAQKKISVVTGSLNEEGNVEELYRRIKDALSGFPAYDHEIIVADNFPLEYTSLKCGRCKKAYTIDAKKVR